MKTQIKRMSLSFPWPACPVLGSPLPKKSNYPNLFYCISVGRAEERRFLPVCRNTGSQTSDPSLGAAVGISGKPCLRWSDLWPSCSPLAPLAQAPRHPLCASISGHLSQNHPQQEDRHSQWSRKSSSPKCLQGPVAVFKKSPGFGR